MTNTGFWSVRLNFQRFYMWQATCKSQYSVHHPCYIVSLHTNWPKALLFISVGKLGLVCMHGYALSVRNEHMMKNYKFLLFSNYLWRATCNGLCMIAGRPAGNRWLRFYLLSECAISVASMWFFMHIHTFRRMDLSLTWLHLYVEELRYLLLLPPNRWQSPATLHQPSLCSQEEVCPN